jgi:hypothetical protein
MAGSQKKSTMTESSAKRCDTKVWSAACERSHYATQSEKYLCVTCGTIPSLDHEVRHDTYSHISGDEDNLS